MLSMSWLSFLIVPKGSDFVRLWSLNLKPFIVDYLWNAVSVMISAFYFWEVPNTFSPDGEWNCCCWVVLSSITAQDSVDVTFSFRQTSIFLQTPFIVKHSINTVQREVNQHGGTKDGDSFELSTSYVSTFIGDRTFGNPIGH